MIASRVKARMEFSRWLWSLGASRRDSLALLASYNSRVVRKRMGWKGVHPVTAHLAHNGLKLPFEFRDASDFVVLNEVFLEQQYALPQALSPTVVLDLGSNTGLSPLFFHGLYPNARIVAVEAHPTTFEQLRRNASRWDKIEPLHLAASDTCGAIPFYGSPSRSISSSIFRRSSADGATKPISVQAESLGRLLDRCGPRVDLLKFDIEGAEQQVFSGFHDWERIGVLVGEVHPDLYGGSLDEFLALFPRHTVTVVSRSGPRAVVRLDPHAPE